MFIYLKFRLQRWWRHALRDLSHWQASFVSYLDQHVWGKGQGLSLIRRFILVWWGTILLVGLGLMSQVKGVESSYLMLRPVAGGTYVEGVIGSVKNVNPILIEDSASADASRLVFNGLTRYTPRRGIEGDLAQSWSVSPDGKVYTFQLRRDVKWHDGAPFTAEDVLYTLAQVQNPDTRSPLLPSWQGVKAEAENANTVVFTLPNPYTPFIYSTTVGILPSHLLKGIEATTLRAVNFNQNPVGTGPFLLKHFNVNDREISLDANPHYHGGRPLLEHFSLRFYPGYRELTEAYTKRQVTAIGRLKTNDFETNRNLANVRLYDLTLPDATGLFFRTTSQTLQDKAVRQALARSIDRTALINQTLGSNATELNLPILPGQIGYQPKFLPPAYDQAAAEKLLDEAGWKRPVPGEVRQKNGQALMLRLVTSSTGDYPEIAGLVKAAWTKLGVKVELTVADLTTLRESHIRARNYDVLLYGINIGADPDVYAYWHSSQASDPGLNLSQYSSPAADKALEGARITADTVIRANKYGTFLAAWVTDVPAVMLYSPHYIYAANASVQGISAKKLVDPADRFYGVEKWTVRTKSVPR